MTWHPASHIDTTVNDLLVSISAHADIVAQNLNMIDDALPTLSMTL